MDEEPASVEDTEQGMEEAMDGDTATTQIHPDAAGSHGYPDGGGQTKTTQEHIQYQLQA